MAVTSLFGVVVNPIVNTNSNKIIRVADVGLFHLLYLFILICYYIVFLWIRSADDNNNNSK